MYRVRVIACGVFILVAQPALAFNQLDGQDCLHQRDNDLRIEACTRILDEANEPANVRAAALVGRGEAFTYKRDYQKALADYEQGIKLDPKNWEGFNGRGVVLAQTGHSERAIADYMTASKLNPRHPLPRINLCKEYIVLDRLSAAVEHCTKSIELQTSPIALRLRGTAYLKMGKFAPAIADFDAALKQSPKYAAALYGRAVAKQKSGDQAGASADMSAAKALDAEVAKGFEKYKLN